MDIVLKQGDELTLRDFEAILALDIKCFGEEILTEAGMAKKRFLKFREGFIAAYEQDVMAGFISFFSVAPSVYERAAERQEFIDDNLKVDEIRAFTKDAKHYILMFDHVVDEEHQNHGISKILIESVQDFLCRKNDEGYEITKIFGYAITKSGQGILSALGGSVLWERKKAAFLELDKAFFLRRL